MRPVSFILPFSLLNRQSIATAARCTPALRYPVFPSTPHIHVYPTCRSRAQPFSSTMADTGAANIAAEPRKQAEEQQSSSGNVDVDKNEAAAAAEVPQEEAKLPPLSAADFRAYNGMAEHMEYFHSNFRNTWNLLYGACESNSRPKNMTIKQFITTGLQFCGHLTAHHSIEEMHIFPILAKRMPEFKNGPKYKGAAELLRQHKEIHDGLDVFKLYLQQCQTGETDFDLRVLKTKMESWGDVLWTHLDQEVKTLGAENMRKYWTVEEMRRMPM